MDASLGADLLGRQQWINRLAQQLAKLEALLTPFLEMTVQTDDDSNVPIFDPPLDTARDTATLARVIAEAVREPPVSPAERELSVKAIAVCDFFVAYCEWRYSELRQWTVRDLEAGPDSPVIKSHTREGARRIALVHPLQRDLERVMRDTGAALNNEAAARVRALDEQLGGSSNRRVRERLSARVRTYVWQRDSGRCVQCGSQERLEYDHIIPWSKGGSDTERNIQLLCERCNRAKQARI